MNDRDIELICNFLMFNFKYYAKKKKKKLCICCVIEHSNTD